MNHSKIWPLVWLFFLNLSSTEAYLGDHARIKRGGAGSLDTPPP